MTNEQMDRLAAEKLMGWKRVSGDKFDYWEISPDFGMADLKFTPTTNEAHSAMVREKMRAEGWGITLTAYSGGDTAQISKGDIHLTVAEEAGRMCYALVTVCLLAVGACTEGDFNG